MNLEAEDTCGQVARYRPRWDRTGLGEADFLAESDFVTPRRGAGCTFVYLTSEQAFLNTKDSVFLHNIYKPFSRLNLGVICLLLFIYYYII